MNKNKNSFLEDYTPTKKTKEYPEGYTEKPNLRKRHPSGFVEDYRYE